MVSASFLSSAHPLHASRLSSLPGLALAGSRPAAWLPQHHCPLSFTDLVTGCQWMLAGFTDELFCLPL